jgi:malectin (di-glucose binding ER protein)
MSSPSLGQKSSDPFPNGPERAEVAAVLASETFRRAPKLSRLLSYLSEKYFEGCAGDIKEYTIAVDVMGRDTRFDPQLDSIVRVDAHNLRKRLRQYYATEGKDHDLVIFIPAGQYTPEFLPRAEIRDLEQPEAVELESISETPIVPASARTSIGFKVSPLWFAIGLAAVVAAVVFSLDHWSKIMPGMGIRTFAASTFPGPGPLISNGEANVIRIVAGDRKTDYIDQAGRAWLADRFFSGGTTFHRGPNEIQHTQDPRIYQQGREGEFVYNIPLKSGVYELHLYFAETGVESEALRSVSVAINGMPVSTVDIASDAGGINAATEKIFKNISPTHDGTLHLTVQGAGSGPGFLNALEIIPAVSGKMSPIRLAARGVYRDHLGQTWVPDEWVSGGRKSSRSSPIEGTPDPDLYQTQRFGHFGYSIPVVEGGRYTVTLHFAETWFATPNSPGGPGSRVFDVYCNGTTLLKSFDILKEGPSNRAVLKVFHNVQASPQGKLDLEFVPIANYATVNAIEIVEE